MARLESDMNLWKCNYCGEESVEHDDDDSYCKECLESYLLVVARRESETYKCLIEFKNIPRDVLGFICDSSSGVHFDDKTNIKKYLEDSYDDHESAMWLYHLFRILEEGLVTKSRFINIYMNPPLDFCRSEEERSEVMNKMKDVAIISVSGNDIREDMKPSMVILLTANPLNDE